MQLELVVLLTLRETPPSKLVIPGEISLSRNSLSQITDMLQTPLAQIEGCKVIQPLVIYSVKSTKNTHKNQNSYL